MNIHPIMFELIRSSIESYDSLVVGKDSRSNIYVCYYFDYGSDREKYFSPLNKVNIVPVWSLLREDFIYKDNSALAECLISISKIERAKVVQRFHFWICNQISNVFDIYTNFNYDLYIYDKVITFYYKYDISEKEMVKIRSCDYVDVCKSGIKSSIDSLIRHNKKIITHFLWSYIIFLNKYRACSGNGYAGIPKNKYIPPEIDDFEPMY